MPTKVIAGLLCLLPLTLACLFVMPAGVQAFEMQRASGKTKLQKAGAFEEGKIQTIKITAGAIEITAKLRIDEFFKRTIVNANAEAKNTADQAMFFQYYVAFMDGEGNLVGAGGQGSYGDDGLAGGKTNNLGSVLIHLEPAQIKKIKRYQIVVYSDTEPIGQSSDKDKDDEAKEQADKPSR